MNDRIAYYTASAVRELERLAIEEYGIAAFELMQRAGTEMFAALNQQGPGVKHLLICCGTGLSGAVRPPFRRLLDAINYSGLPALSADIPSGLCSDTGSVLGACPLHCGRVVFADLGVPPAIFEQVPPLFYR
jgi:NAD(P)H-hydrate repair Nnr-like enzyme with NAD(P)H-hydrate epimerase domain